MPRLHLDRELDDLLGAAPPSELLRPDEVLDELLAHAQGGPRPPRRRAGLGRELDDLLARARPRLEPVTPSQGGPGGSGGRGALS